ncbi:hypothetical protein GmHk_03G006640 [Glycine max]|nr:hypothetical protein GmHk_03G006640 [Glycine max]
MANKPPLTNKTFLHPPLRHLHSYHKRKHQTEMNIPLLTKIPLYDFIMKTWIILLRMRINSSLITSITKAMTKVMTKPMMRVLTDQRHLRYLRCNISNLVGVLEVGTTFDDKTQCIRAIKEYNIRNHFDCRTIYSDQRRLNFVCKLHENGCTWSLGACNSKRHNKWIIKSIRDHQTCLVSMLRQDHRQLDKHVIAQIIQPIIKTNPTVSIKTLITEIKMFMNYTPSYKKTWLAKQKALEMIHGNWEESYAKLPKLFGALQSCVPGTVVATQTEFLYEGGEIVLGKRLFKRVFWSFGPCINGFAYCKPIVQVDGTWLYRKYTSTLLIATAQDRANHIFPIAYAIVEGETTSAWDRHPSIISAYNNPSNLWVQDTSHFFCLRHIAQKFLRGNSNCKHLKKPLMLAGYAYTEKMHWRHLGDIRANKPSAVE